MLAVCAGMVCESAYIHVCIGCNRKDHHLDTRSSSVCSGIISGEKRNKRNDRLEMTMMRQKNIRTRRENTRIQGMLQ